MVQRSNVRYIHIAPAPGNSQPVTVANILITPGGLPSTSMRAAETLQLTATVTDFFGHALSTAGLQWLSSNPAAATISPTGLVTGVAIGTTQITASLGGVIAALTLSVTAALPTYTFGATVAQSIQNNFANYAARIYAVFCMDAASLTFDGSLNVSSWASVLGYGGAVHFAPNSAQPKLVQPDVNDRSTWYIDTTNGGDLLLNPATGLDYHGTGAALIAHAAFNDFGGSSQISIDDGASGIMAFQLNTVVGGVAQPNSVGGKIDTQQFMVRERYPTSRMKVGMISRSARRFSIEFPPIPMLKSTSQRLPAGSGARVWFGYDPAGGHRVVQGNCVIIMQSEWTATEKATLMAILAHHCGAHADDATRMVKGRGDSITASFFATATTWFRQLMDMAKYKNFGDVDMAVPTATSDLSRLPEGDGLFFEATDSVPERGTRYASLRIPGRKNIVFHFHGTNDVALYGDDGPTSWANFTARCLEDRLAGDYVIAVPMIPRAEAGDQTFFNAARDYWKANIAAGKGVYYDDYVDLLNDATWGPNGNTATLQGLGFVDGGGTHPTTAGHADLATRLMSPALDRAITALGIVA